MSTEAGAAASAARWRIAVDTGGTFTDCAGIDPRGRHVRCKVLSSGFLRATVRAHSDDGAEDSERNGLILDQDWNLPDGFLNGFEARFERGRTVSRVADWERSTRRLVLDRPPGAAIAIGDVIELSTGEEAPVLGVRILTGTPLGASFPDIDFRLATTRGTNALLERAGSPPVFFVTRGFGDLLRIGDQRRPDLFALEHRIPPPLHDAVVIEIEERLDAQGGVVTPLGLEAVRQAARRAVAGGARSAAVALAHSYRNPEHEQRIGDVLRDCGFAHVSLSSELAPLIRLLPRAQTAVVDACLAPIMTAFLDAVSGQLGEPRSFRVMTSAGGLERSLTFRPKDSLLSGPAGGMVGASEAGRRAGCQRLLTLDMGGTSTDVARWDGSFDYAFQQVVGDVRLLAPALRIETVAAGGGSICRLGPNGLSVGPESAGSSPGPACYGMGGPLTLTDVNLLLGRFDPERAPIPIRREPARERLAELTDALRAAGMTVPEDEELLRGLLRIAVERMAAAIRRISIEAGFDPADHTLLAFGGAGPQHACEVADCLGMSRILVPESAGLLSAEGVLAATPERFAERQILEPLPLLRRTFPAMVRALEEEALRLLVADGVDAGRAAIRRRIAELRLSGQESPLQVEIGTPDAEDLERAFRLVFADTYGFAPPDDRAVELVSLRVAASESRDAPAPEHFEPWSTPMADSSKGSGGERIVQSESSTTVVTPGWSILRGSAGSLLLTRETLRERVGAPTTESCEVRVPLRGNGDADSPVEAELFRSRFEGIVEEMGARLKRTAVSTNVKEREDYSCAILDASGRLIVNAPHIPVHLGALGLCVREVARELAMADGDVVVTNHPHFGGSHLPDVTLIAPVFDADGRLLAHVANRAHHAEIGGRVPGSMPPDARTLAEEGVVIPPMRLFTGGVPDYAALESLFANAPLPSRCVADNLLDLRAQAASVLSGRRRLAMLAAEHGSVRVRRHLDGLAGRAARAMAATLRERGPFQAGAEEILDDGSRIRVRLVSDGQTLEISFAGTSGRHPFSLNATPAITRSAVLYALRLWVREDLPLNEGLLDPVRIVLPDCFLNPGFDPADPSRCPAVVGGNVETSQRIVDALVRALELQAGSQGTMNNVIFGSPRFGYYETLGGGTGAGPGYDGADAIHSHMTNTAVTDVEVIESRYPVRIEEFAIRKGSGGTGRHRGGDGLTRAYRFLEPAVVSLLTEHRNAGPAGMDGGGDGAPGRQTLARPGQPALPLDHRCTIEVQAGDLIRLETPAGGGWGAEDSDTATEQPP